MKLPTSAPSRRDRGWLRLLTSIDCAAPRGLQFAGQLLTPGAECSMETLPRPAVLLECAGSVRVAAARSRYSFETLWLLWRFDFEASRWIEIVRTTSRDSAWTLDFAPVAYRHLHPAPEADAPEDRAAPVNERIAAFIASQLAEVTSDVRCYVLAGLDRYVAAQIVRATAALSVFRRPAVSADPYPRIGAHLLGAGGELRPRAHW